VEHLCLDGRVVKAGGALDGPNEECPCITDRFGFSCVRSFNRPTRPLIRTDGASVSASWDGAPDHAAGALGRLKSGLGPDAVMAFTSAASSNAENLRLQKSIRPRIGTSRINSCDHSSAVAGQAATQGAGAMIDSIREIPLTKVIFGVGFNATGEHPVRGVGNKQAADHAS